MSNIKHFIKEYAFIILCICIISLSFIFSFKICIVSGESMVPTFYNKEMILMKTKVDKYERYEVIVFNNEKTTGNYIKRIVGLPGETLYMEDNTIYVNGKSIKDVVNINIKDYGSLKEGVTLGPNEYFVLGDNRNNSHDSRVIGPVSNKDIRGKVTYSISNLKKFDAKGEWSS